MTMLSRMLPGWQCSATCWWDDDARLHVARMTMLGHMLIGWRCSTTCCQDDDAQLHVNRMTMLSHMLMGWQCSATCWWDDDARPHVHRMTLQKLTDLGYENLFHLQYSDFSLTNYPFCFLFSSSIWTLFMPKNILFQRKSRNCF